MYITKIQSLHQLNYTKNKKGVKPYFYIIAEIYPLVKGKGLSKMQARTAKIAAGVQKNMATLALTAFN